MYQEILDFLGKAICHQLPERSLLISGEPLSICARDTGIYLGIFSTLVYLFLFKRNKMITIPTIKVSFLLLIFMVPMMIDGLGSYSHLFESNNARRIVTGLCFGFALPFFVFPLLSAKALDRNSEPVIKHGTDLFVPFVLSAVLGMFVYAGMLPYYFIDTLLIITVVIWFSFLALCFFSFLHNRLLKWPLSFLSSLVLLVFLSFLHGFFMS